MKTGIYQIRNLVNGKRYIGSAAGVKGFAGRWNEHKRLANAGRHHSVIFQRAWDKYGARAFTFEVLLYCDPRDCITFEQMAIDCYKPEYNICLIAGSTLGLKWSEASKKNRCGDKHPMYGKNHTTLAKDKIKQAVTQRHAENDCAAIYNQISISLRGSKNPSAKLNEVLVSQIKHQLDSGVAGQTIASKFGVCKSTISQIKNGHIWSHV